MEKVKKSRKPQEYEEPFYERLRRQDNEREVKNKTAQLQRSEKRSKAAAFNKDGKCMLNMVNWKEIAKKDEKKARKEKEIIDSKNLARETIKQELLAKQK
jgi:hypothetical protein